MLRTECCVQGLTTSPSVISDYDHGAIAAKICSYNDGYVLVRDAQRRGANGSTSVVKQRRISPDDKAITTFVDTFITEIRRDRARRLLLGDYEQRIKGLQALPEWIDTSVTTQQLRGARPPELGRYGAVQGWCLDDKSFELLTLRDMALGGGFGALFVSDDMRIALLVPELGDVILCNAAQKSKN